MNMKKRISIILAMLLIVTSSAFQPNVFAEMQQIHSDVEQIEAMESQLSDPKSESPPVKVLPSSSFEAFATSGGNTEIIFDKNQKKAQFKIDKGFDLDKYLYRSASPIKIEIDLFEFKPDPLLKTRVTFRVYDVDQTGGSNFFPEVDKVYCNGTYLGNLTGADSQWSTVSLDIPAGVLKAGVNKFEVHIDEHNQGWAVEVDWASIELPFNIAHVESKVTGDEKIKRGKTDDIIGDTIWKTEFTSNGEVKSPIINDPIADKIKGSFFFNAGSRKFNYEYKIDCWPTSLKSQFEPVVKYKWEIVGTDINSGEYKEMNDIFNNWISDFDVTIPDKVGKYELKVSLKIYYEKELLREEKRIHTLYVLLDTPAKVKGIWSSSSPLDTLTITTPKTAWLDISTKWANDMDNANDILSSINTKEHSNPFGWVYGYYDDPNAITYKEDAITLLENGTGKYSDCFVFRDAWRVLSGTLGVETKSVLFDPGYGFLTSTKKALDNNNFANASSMEDSNIHDRWLFGCHAIGKYDKTYYDPTFGISYSDVESNIYAKEVTRNKYEEVATGNEVRVTPELDDSKQLVIKGGWDHVNYQVLSTGDIKYTGKYTENLVDEDSNGLYDYLKLDVEFVTEMAGTYILDAYLYSQEGSLITKGAPSTENKITSHYVTVDLKEGKQNLSIYFKGNHIKNSGADGSYSVEIDLIDKKSELFEIVEIVTDFYKCSDFQGILLEIDEISDNGTDVNSDSLFDTLDFNFNLNVLSAGEFTVSGMLFSEDGIHLGTAETVKKLNRGKQTLSLKFVGQALRYSEIDGPYTLYIDYDDGKYCGFSEYASKDYSHMDFQVSDVAFTGENYDAAIDTNGNNFFDELNIKAQVVALIPEDYKIHGILQDKKGNFIQSSTVTMELGEEPSTAELCFEGTYINKSAIDGPYEVILSVSDEDGNDLAGFKYETNDYKYTDFESPSACFSGNFTDKGIDSNSDSLFDVLSIGVGVKVSKAAYYSIEGTLSDKNGNFITSIGSDYYLSLGDQTINLNFNGGDIYNNAVDGSYTLSSLELIDIDTGVSVASLLDAYNTTEYSWSQFQTSQITVIGTPVETTIDNNDNGQYDVLKITMDVFTPSSGYYSYNARIVDKNGEEIIWSSSNASLSAGVNKLSLTFDGRYIYGNGENGPFHIKDLTIYSGNEVFSLLDFYTTKAYSWADFEPISVIYGTASTGYMPIENANIFISGVSTDITNSEGKYRLKVIKEGSYNIRVDALSIYAPWEIWVNGEKYADSISTYITIPQSGEIEVNFISKAELPPVLKHIGNKAVNSNEKLEFTLSALEPNGQTVTYSVYNETKGASFDPESGLFRWTPHNSDTGIHKDIKFIVSDGALVDDETIDITVIYKNRPPILKPIGNISINENEPLTVSLAVYDPDGDTVACSVYNGPEGSQFDILTNTLKWTPNYSQAGVYDDIRFEVYDGELTNSETIQITVNNVNRAPVLNPIGNITAQKGQAVKINLSASDPDDDTVAFAVYNAPEGFVLDPITNIFTWMPDYSVGKDYSGIRFIVSDGKLTDEETITITVSTPTPVLTPNPETATTPTATPMATPIPTSNPGGSSKPLTSKSTSKSTSTPALIPTPTPATIEEPEVTIPDVNKLQHKAYLLGYPDGYFKPENNITRAEAVAIFANILKSKKLDGKVSPAVFTDVPESHWASEAINYVASMEIFKGYTDGSFKPDQTITRAEFSVAVFKLIGIKLSKTDKSGFTDTLEHWASGYIDQLYALGFIKGYSDRTFKPDSLLKRSECVTLINRALNRGPLGGTEQIFKDVPTTHWAYEEIAESAVDHIYILTEDKKEKLVKE